MRLHRIWLTVGMLAALLAAATSGAQQIRNWKMIAGTLTTPAINDTITAINALSAAQLGTTNQGVAFTAESTAVFDASLYRNIVLHFHVIGTGGDTTNSVVLAVAPKCFPQDLNGLNAPDSLASLLTPNPVTAGFAAGTLPPPGGGGGLWPGEFSITINPVLGTAQKSNAYFSPGSQDVDLGQTLGVNGIGCGLMQIRVRCLQYNSADATKKPRIQLWVMGYN